MYSPILRAFCGSLPLELATIIVEIIEATIPTAQSASGNTAPEIRLSPVKVANARVIAEIIEPK